ncbi:MAG: c-type cytochrome [Acidobacteria bacterium]|nr:c-type cytochrome [Acidobacteriota bacterium]
MRPCANAVLISITVVTMWGCAKAPEEQPKPSPVERGKYLVSAMACGDCHTPRKMGKSGPEPDPALFLSGHPASLSVDPVPQFSPGPWGAAVSTSWTAWAGPWGISFAANLTSDEETGMGVWDDAMFVGAMRSGLHLGAGRPILPPMPWSSVGSLSDEDLKAILAYLKSTPPIKNEVPDAVVNESVSEASQAAAQ